MNNLDENTAMIRPSRLLWTTVAALLVLWSGFLLWISDEFVYGEGHQQRPILEFILLFLAGWLIYLGGFFLARRRSAPRFRYVAGVALVLRLILLPSNLIQENDVYRYVLDGQVLLHGGNPYQYPPLTLVDSVTGELKQSLDRLESRLVLDRIGYPHISTIYPPAAQAVFALGGMIGGWNWLGQRIVFTVFDLGVIALLALLLLKLGQAPGWTFLYAWNPLVLKEITNSAHLDVLVLFFLLLSFLFLLKYRSRPSGLWAALVGVAMAGAVLAKLYPLVLVPAVAVYLWRVRQYARHMAVLLFSGAASVVAAYWPFIDIGWDQLTSGLSIYAANWNMNQGAAALMFALGDTRWLAYAPALVAAFLLPLRRRETEMGGLILTVKWIMLLWLLFLPAVFPWYAVPLIGMLALRAGRQPATDNTILALSGLLGLYYLSFFFEYHALPSSGWVAVRAAEHLAIWATLLLSALVHKYDDVTPARV